MIYFGAEGRQLRRSPPHLARCCDDGESERYHNTSCYLAPKEGRRDGGVEMLGPYQVHEKQLVRPPAAATESPLCALHGKVPEHAEVWCLKYRVWPLGVL